MGRRSYGSGSLVVRADANGAETFRTRAAALDTARRFP